jgi:Fe-S cluster assembly protein SufD
MLDFRTLQDHHAAHTTSELLFKGAVEDEADSVYSGLIRLRAGALRANATQTNRNLVLSEGATAKSIPNLEIECDDVRCSHASAVGPIDADQLYYLATRGVPPDVAERLIVFGFFQDAIDRLAFRFGAQRLRSAVTRKFDARRCCHPGTSAEKQPIA